MSRYSDGVVDALGTAELISHAKGIFGNSTATQVLLEQKQNIALLQQAVIKARQERDEARQANQSLLKEGREILAECNEFKRRTEVLQEENESLQRRSEELEIEQSARIAQSNTMVGEYEIIKSNPDIEPVFIAPGEENKLERARLREHFKQQAKENGGDTIHGALTREELLRYHEQRKSGIKNPSFD